ncbi:ferric iron reductase [Rhizobiaceae bacterium n13]|uniref:Ferric iron reductase n=1 Tax=Ferirhizobium litorale TaxID=2927786 RepID=A0AAE3QDY8_9HYPH|nr:ferric iron reductase [Fererhizobium litorale]MDI7863493.1 ferric iron reductase [Fererhizobium litorale]MDI7922230.1 ferric iron reductase [Fererhizobium litorale]
MAGSQQSDSEAIGEALSWLTGLWPSLEVTYGTPDADMFSAVDLGDPGSNAVAQLLAYHRQLLPRPDARTLAASVLGQYSYFLGLAAAAPYLLSGTVPDLSAGNLFFRLVAAEEGADAPFRRFHLRLLSAVPSMKNAGHFADPPARRALLQQILEDHLRPLVMALRQISSFGRDAQWRIAGDSVAAAFLEIGRRLGETERATAEALAILRQPGSAFRNKQLDFVTLRVATPDAGVIEETFRLRGGCCRLYKLDGGSLCPTCVLAEPQWREEQLRRLLLERSGFTAS